MIMFTSMNDVWNFWQRIEGLEYVYEIQFDLINQSLPEENRSTFKEFMEQMPENVRERYNYILEEEKKGNFIPYF